MKVKNKKNKMKARAKTKPKTKARIDRSANGEALEVLDLAGPKPAPKTGPGLNLRARNQAQIDRIKKAAAKANMSMNTWAVEVLDRAAELQ